MIKVLFDHEIFSEQRFGGISRYFVNLANEMNKGKAVSVKIGVLYSKNYYLKNFNQWFDNPFGRWLLRKAPKRYHWNKKYSKSLLNKANFDIFHATYYNPYSLPYNKKPLVVTIHDMIHEDNPNLHSNSAEIIENKKKMMDASSAIIAISNFTKNEILKFYPNFEEKITVIHHGLPKSAEKNSDEQSKANPFNNYILFVGLRGLYKNFNVFTEAVTPLLKRDKKLKIVCVGGDSFSESEHLMLTENDIRTQCIQIDADDSTLKILYQNAIVFAYPSAHEGFGLPILEAFQNGCPVVGSNLSCLPEIGADAIEYFNPAIKSEILNAVEKVIYQKSYADELIKKGYQRLLHFTMEECIDKTIAVYQKALNI